jgi:hypothetical protein
VAKKASESKPADAKKSTSAGKTKAGPAAPSLKKTKAKAAPKAAAKTLFPDAVAETPAPKKPAAKKEPAAKRAFTSDEIGHVAGDVWQTLHEHGAKTAAELTKAVAAPPELVAAALGWLAREGKLEFETNGRSVTVSLA